MYRDQNCFQIHHPIQIVGRRNSNNDDSGDDDYVEMRDRAIINGGFKISDHKFNSRFTGKTVHIENLIIRNSSTDGIHSLSSFSVRFAIPS